jgi:AsmA protein
MNTNPNPQKKSLISRILKWTGLTFLALLIFAIAAPVLFKGKIIAKVEDEMNQNMNAKVKLGDVDLSFLSSFPDFRLSMKNFYIAIPLQEIRLSGPGN